MRGLMCNSLNILPLYLPIFLKNNVMTHKTFFFHCVRILFIVNRKGEGMFWRMSNLEQVDYE